MEKNLPSRPNLEHLRGQAKALLSDLKASDIAAARTFIEHLPAAANLSLDRVFQAGFRLADAQSAIAKKTGFASWPGLARHVAQLRALEGTWRFTSLEVNGSAMAEAMYSEAKIIMDGDLFGTAGMGGDFEGVFLIDVEASPHTIDIQFQQGPHAGKTAYGIYELDGDDLAICLGLVGFSRPSQFTTTPGSGHALERLRRESSIQERLTPAIPADRPAFVPTPDALEMLQGEWQAIAITLDGTKLPKGFAAAGRRITSGDRTTVKFGNDVYLSAITRLDRSTDPWETDYLHDSGQIQLGIARMVDDVLETCLGAPDGSRPAEFASTAGSKQTHARWKRV